MDNREQQILHSWNQNASAWTESVRSHQIDSRNVATNKAIIDAIVRHGPTNVLDVGCGEGWLVRELSQHGLEVTGTDGAAPLIDKARELGIGTFHLLTYEELGSAGIINKTDYDAIVCNFALVGESIGDLLVSLRNLLSDRGRLFIQTLHPFATCDQNPYEDGWRTETFSGFGAGYREAMPWYFRTVGSWLNVCKIAGLQVEDCEEPVHPSTGKPLSLLLTCANQAP